MPAVAAPSDPAGSLPDELDALLSLSTSKQVRMQLLMLCSYGCGALDVHRVAQLTDTSPLYAGRSCSRHGINGVCECRARRGSIYRGLAGLFVARCSR